uniref:Cytochrome P450 n=1 Tax=Megaselia scalaris TaxID=36166 RepID=T1GVF9_MEGSC
MLIRFWSSFVPTFPTGNFSRKLPSFMSIREVYNKFKGQSPIAGFYFFLKPAAMIMDLDLVKNVLIKDFSNFAERNGFSNEEDDPLTAHLLNLDEERWRSLRNKISSTFSSGKMKFMFPTVVEVSKRFSEKFGESAKLENSTIEIKELLARFTTDVIGNCAFGIECNSLKDPNAEFRTKGRQLLTEPRHNPVIRGMIIAFPSIAKKLHVRIVPDHIHNFFMGVVRDTVEYREKNHIVKNDFLNLLIELKNKKENSLTLEQVAAQCF